MCERLCVVLHQFYMPRLVMRDQFFIINIVNTAPSYDTHKLHWHMSRLGTSHVKYVTLSRVESFKWGGSQPPFLCLMPDLMMEIVWTHAATMSAIKHQYVAFVPTQQTPTQCLSQEPTEKIIH